MFRNSPSTEEGFSYLRKSTRLQYWLRSFQAANGLTLGRRVHTDPTKGKPTTNTNILSLDTSLRSCAGQVKF